MFVSLKLLFWYPGYKFSEEAEEEKKIYLWGFITGLVFVITGAIEASSFGDDTLLASLIYPGAAIGIYWLACRNNRGVFAPLLIIALGAVFMLSGVPMLVEPWD